MLGYPNYTDIKAAHLRNRSYDLGILYQEKDDLKRVFTYNAS